MAERLALYLAVELHFYKKLQNEQTITIVERRELTALLITRLAVLQPAPRHRDSSKPGVSILLVSRC